MQHMHASPGDDNNTHATTKTTNLLGASRKKHIPLTHMHASPGDDNNTHATHACIARRRQQHTCNDKNHKSTWSFPQKNILLTHMHASPGDDNNTHTTTKTTNLLGASRKKTFSSHTCMHRPATTTTH